MSKTHLMLATALSLGMSGLAQANDGKANSIGKKVADFTLKDYRGKPHSLADFKASKLVVVVYMGTECPLAKLYGPRLAQLAKEYKAKGVAFIGINANSQDAITEIAAHARIHKIPFPVLKDLQNQVADAMGAVRTPEAFVLDQERAIRYQGRIDDQYGVGYIRDNSTRDYLRAAIDELLADKQVSKPWIEPVGCYIGRVSKIKSKGKITYSKEIARILQNRCVECHRSGDIAPFALTSYKEVAGWAETIVEVIEDGRMPPWHANPKYGKFANHRGLTEEEKKQVFAWVADGAPEGDPKNLPEPRQFASGWQLPQKPDMVVPITKTPYKVQAEGVVRYKYFRVDPGFKEDKWVKMAELLPGNRAIVHHILVFAAPPGGRTSALNRGFLAGYVPGKRAHPFPDGMAKRIPAGSQLIFQMHFTPIGSEQFDQSKLGLVFADPKEVKYEIRTVNASQRFLRIPPNDGNHRVEATSRRPIGDCRLIAFMPHMHLRGKSFRYEARYPDGKKQVLLDVPRYDFNWQTRYTLAEPMPLPAGTKMQCTAYFDNSEENLNNPDPSKTIRWGDQTWDEMMIGYFDIALPVEKSAEGKPKPAKPEISDRAKAYFKKLDANGDGKIVIDEVPERLRKVFKDVDRNGDKAITLKELNQILRGLGN